MFGWFRRAECPISPEDERWIDHRMAWLVEQFGKARLHETQVILPTPEFFPEPFDGTEEDALVLLHRVCTYMGIDPDRVELQLYSEGQRETRGPHVVDLESGTAGLYEERDQSIVVWLETRQLEDPARVVATLAHELAHVHLLGDRRVSREAVDMEPLTDLATVFLGMGVFTANTILNEAHWHSGQLSYWQMGRHGYLTAPLLGYALALWADYRDDLKTRWARRLRLDVREPFQQALRYFSRSEKSPVVKPDPDPGYPPGAFGAFKREHDPEKSYDEYGFEELDLPPGESDSSFTRGVCHLMHGDAKSAIEELSHALDADPDDAEAYHYRSIAHWYQDDPAAALADAGRFLELSPGDPGGHQVRGMCRLAMNHFRGALADFIRVTEEHPDGAQGYHWCGKAFLAMGLYEEALAKCHQAIYRDPRQAQHYLTRAEVYDKLGLAEKAERDREEAFRRDPHLRKGDSSGE
jgi:tetratricopeptide (TPR) repeat protein